MMAASLSRVRLAETSTSTRGETTKEIACASTQRTLLTRVRKLARKCDRDKFYRGIAEGPILTRRHLEASAWTVSMTDIDERAVSRMVFRTVFIVGE